MNKIFKPSYPPLYQQRCAEVLDEAIHTTEAYQSWCGFDPGMDGEILTRFKVFPSLTKKDIRKFGPQAFVPHGRDIRKGLNEGIIELVSTSGTTNDKVTNIWYQPWWNASEAASWNLNSHARRNATGEHREAILTSPYCAGFPCEDRFLTMKERTLGRFLYLTERYDPCSWSKDLMNRMIEEINVFKPVILEANPSYLARLSRYITRNNLKIHSPALIVLTYENPSSLHYRQIKGAFDAPTASSYGATEAGYVFMECEYHTLHQVTENVHVDFLPFLPEQGGPEIGRILVSTFNNPWRSLLRFDIGDVVRIKGQTKCPCGCVDGMSLASIEGRTTNLTLTPDGMAVTQGRVDRLLGNIRGLAQYQLVQTASCEYLLKYTPDENEENPVLSGEIQEALKTIYGKKSVISTEPVEELHPDLPGKYRLTFSLNPKDPDIFLDPKYAPRRN
jgi:phenylacetate-CoA ligase